MASTILRYIIDDIVLDLKQTLDDRLIQRSQIAYWTLLIGNRLKAQHISKRDSGAFLSTFADIPVEEFTSNGKNEIKGRKYIKLPKCIYDYDMDGAIEYMSYYIEEEQDGCPPPFTDVQFSRTSQSSSRRLYGSIYEKPAPDNPYFYRVGDYLYLLGLEKVDVKFIEIGLYASLDPLTEIDIDAPFDFPDELIAILKRQVVDLGRFSLLIPKERVNDGDDDSKSGAVPTNKIVSVNELEEPTETKK